MLQKISEKLQNSGDNLGNKGKFLCLMHEAGFRVPDGIIVDKSEYENFIDCNGITEQITKHLSELKKENVSEKSASVMALFEGTNLTEQVSRTLQTYIKDDCKYAVRSSGTKEDLEEFSFAGQYRTFLNVQGISAIEQAVIDCYKSMFTEVCLNYFVNNRIDCSDLAMSVVVQEMVYVTAKAKIARTMITPVQCAPAPIINIVSSKMLWNKPISVIAKKMSFGFVPSFLPSSTISPPP